MSVKPDPLTQALIAQGKLLEAGFVGLMIACDLQDAPPDQRHEMRCAFFCGAQHLWHSMMAGMDEGDTETPADMQRMAMIQAELDAFIADFKARHLPTKGSA